MMISMIRAQGWNKKKAKEPCCTWKMRSGSEKAAALKPLDQEWVSQCQEM